MDAHASVSLTTAFAPSVQPPPTLTGIFSAATMFPFESRPRIVIVCVPVGKLLVSTAQ
jgi:hypothetical protein